MLRRYFSPSLPSFAARSSVFVRFCSSSSSSTSSSSSDTTTVDPVTQKCIDLDTKTSAWSLNKQDVKEALTLLDELVDGKKELPPVKNHFDLIQYRDDELRLAQQKEPRVVQVPYSISALYRTLFNYTGYQTLVQTPTKAKVEAGGKVTPPPSLDRFTLRRLNMKDEDRFPQRSLVARGLMCCSLPLNPNDLKKQYFMLGFPEDKPFKHIIDQGQNDENGHLDATSIAGYELMQFAERTPLIRNQLEKSLLTPEQREEQQKSNDDNVPYTFEGIAVNTGGEQVKTSLIANTPDTLMIARRIAKEASLETALVLTKSILEDESTTDENFLYNEKYTRLVNEMISIVAEESVYFILQNNKGGMMIFTSMHHLHRFRRLSWGADPEKWEEYGPWKIGATTGAHIQFINEAAENASGDENIKKESEKDLSHVINPTAISDYDAHDSLSASASACKFPGHDLRFTRKTIDTLTKLAEERRKARQQQQQQS